jgi:hypothetical protein
VWILTRFCYIARTFATASRAAATAGSRRVAMATAGVVTASALSYAYLQSMYNKLSTRRTQC